MSDINQNLITLMRSVFEPEDRTPENIAGFLADKIVRSEIPLGHELFTQRELMSGLAITMTTSEVTWRILKDNLQLITTFRTNGTRVIDELPQMLAEDVAAILEEPAHMFHAANFSETSLFGLAMSNDDFSKPLEKDIVHSFRNLSPVVSIGLMQNLESQMLKIASNKLSYDVGKHELYFSDQYKELLDCACQAALGKSKKFVMFNLSPAVVNTVLDHAGYTVHQLTARQLPDRLTQLDDFCNRNQVGVVYFSASSPFPFKEVFNNKFWRELKKIQKKWGFIIMMDDSLSLSDIPPTICEEIETGKNNSIIYISPAAILHPKFKDVNYIVGPKDIINKIKAKCINKDPQIPMSTAIALYNTIRKGSLSKNTARAHIALDLRRKIVDKYLLSLNLFEERFIRNQEGWFYYLEPKAGTRFIDNIFQRLFYRKIYVMDKGLYNRDPRYSKGIMISISAFQNDDACKRTLERLAFNLTKMIIPNEVLVS